MTTLERLPFDVLELIASRLDLESICRARLSCKHLSAKFSGPAFQQFIKVKKITMDRNGMADVKSLASHPTFGPAVQDLTLVTPVYDTKPLEDVVSTRERRVTERDGVFGSMTTKTCTTEELEKAASDLERMKAQQMSQRTMQADGSMLQCLTDALRSFGDLSSLHLEAAVHQEPSDLVSTRVSNVQQLLVAASTSYRLIATAIALSKVKLHTLILFHNTNRCSIPITDIGAHMPALMEQGFDEAAATIRRMSFSMSTSAEADIEETDNDGTDNDEADDDENTEGIAPETEHYSAPAELLAPMHDLEDLEIHFYRDRGASIERYDEMFSEIAAQRHWPRLRKCSLRGLRVRQEDLILFFQKHASITTLELHEISLTQGTWPPVFAQLCSMTNMERVSLSTLWSQRLVSLRLPGEKAPEDYVTWLPCTRGPLVHTRMLSRTKLETGLPFCTADTGRTLGSPQSMNWTNSRRVLYG